MTTDSSGATRRAFLKGAVLGGAALLLGDSPASAYGGGTRLPRANPQDVGVDPAGIIAFVEAVNQKVGGLHSMMLLRHGKVAAEGWWSPYEPRFPHMLFSLSKSFTSTAVGIAVSEGRLTVDAPVVSFFPDRLPPKVSDNLAAMRVRHLLTMSTGHDKDATGPATSDPDRDWVKGFLALPVEHEPGSKFVYNSAATYMLSAIVQKLTGETLLQYLTPRLFGPLGIDRPTWDVCPKGINTGGWGLNVRTEDIARFGQLYLQKGRWNGRQLVPESWVQEATSKQVSNGSSETSDWNQGYGYQFWRCRHNLYRGDGAFGQFCIVMPAQVAVLAITSGVSDMQAVMNAAWDHLLPAMKDSPPGSAADTSNVRRLLQNQSVPPPEGSPESPQARRISGRTWRMEPNEEKVESIRLVFRGDRCQIVRLGASEVRLECGAGGWIKGTAPMGSSSPLFPQAMAKVAARGAWTDANTYTARLCFYETPFIQTVTFKFDGDSLTVSSRMNVGFGPTERPPLKGFAAS